MQEQFMKVRRLVGASAFALALLFVAWLPLGALEIIPFVLTLPGEPSLRVHAAAAVACLAVAAWGFWNIQ
jgi:hypothetical protein